MIWAAGVTASGLGGALAEQCGAEVDKAGRILVEPDLTLPANPAVFAIGDMIRVRDRKGEALVLPGVAPVAMQQGRYVAKAVRARLEGRSVSPFHYLDKGNLATIGRARCRRRPPLPSAQRFPGGVADLALRPPLVPDRLPEPAAGLRPLVVQLPHPQRWRSRDRRPRDSARLTSRLHVAGRRRLGPALGVVRGVAVGRALVGVALARLALVLAHLALLLCGVLLGHRGSSRRWRRATRKLHAMSVTSLTGPARAAPEREVSAHTTTESDTVRSRPRLVATARRARSPLMTIDEKRARLAGRRVLITGASSGVGLAATLAFAREGARLALVSRNPAAIEPILLEHGVQALILPADLADRDATERAVEDAVSELGGLDIVVSNAAAAVFGHVLEVDPDDFDRTVAVTFTGAVNVIRAALPHLRESRGTVVATGSLMARAPLPTWSAYAAAKHALRGFLTSLQIEELEQRSGVRCAMVHPGPIDTPFFAHATSGTARTPRVPPDAYRPEVIAQALVEVAIRPRAEVVLGGETVIMDLLDTYARPVSQRMLMTIDRWYRSGDQPAPDPGRPVADARASPARAAASRAATACSRRCSSAAGCCRIRSPRCASRSTSPAPAGARHSSAPALTQPVAERHLRRRRAGPAPADRGRPGERLSHGRRPLRGGRGSCGA